MQIRWKDGMTDEQVRERVLRDYLIRCHRLISKDYPSIANMDPTSAADYLLDLRKKGKIQITLFRKSASHIGCRIVGLDQATES